NLGAAYQRLQDFDRAIDCYERALRYWREIGNSVEESRTLCNLGLIYNQKGDADKSLELLRAALGGRVDGKYLRTDTDIINNMALSHLRRGQGNRAPGEYQLAMECFEQALQLSRENRASSSEARILAGMAEAHEALDQFELARKKIDQAVAIAEKIRAEIFSPEHRMLSQPWLTMFYRIQAHTLMSLHQKDPAAGYDALALRNSEQYRLRNLIELLSGLKIELSQGIDAEDLRRLRELQLKLETVETSRAQSLSRKQTEKLAALDREIEELLRQKELLDAQICASHPQYAELKMPTPLSPHEIQRRLLDDDTIM